MKVYKSLDEISVYLFYKILETNDFTYLIKKRKKHSSEKTKVELKEIFNNIIDEYSNKTNNFKLLSNIKKRILIDKIELEYNILKSILNLFEETEDINVLYILDDIGFNFKKNKDIDSELKIVVRKCKLLKNSISIKKIKYANSNKKDSSSNINDLDYSALNLEKSLDLKYKIELKTTSMLRWINLINLSKKLNKNE